MSKLFILVGIPGTGKSTWANTFLSHAEVVSSDAIREELTGDATDQSVNKQVFNLFHQRIGEQLAQQNDVIADSTALDARSRAELVSIAATFDADVYLVVFSNLAQAARRNATRDRVVPDDVMIRMIDKYERFLRDLPEESDSYAGVTTVKALS